MISRVLRFLFGTLAILVIGACTPAASPRATARAAVVSIAHGVLLGADACHVAVLAREGAGDAAGALAMGRKCSGALHKARDAARLGASAVDGWDDGKNPTCAIGAGVIALAEVAEISGTKSEELADVLKFASGFGKDCR